MVILESLNAKELFIQGLIMSYQTRLPIETTSEVYAEILSWLIILAVIIVSIINFGVFFIELDNYGNTSNLVSWLAMSLTPIVMLIAPLFMKR